MHGMVGVSCTATGWKVDIWAGRTGSFFFSSRRRHTRFDCDWSSDVCSSDLLLAPGVQDTEEADLCPKVSRIARHFEEGFRTGTKQKIIEDLLVLQDQWRQATEIGRASCRERV